MRREFLESGTWRIRQFITGITLANVRLQYVDDGLYVYVQLLGEGEWEENFAAFGFLFGEDGTVERIE